MSETTEYMDNIGCETREDYISYLIKKWQHVIDKIVTIGGHPVLPEEHCHLLHSKG